MKILRALVLTLFTSVIFCFPAYVLTGEEVKKITLEEILSLGSLEDDVLFQWTGVSSDAEGFIYVTDSMDFSLKKFGADGRLLKKVGRKGQGPGEFSAPRLLDCSKSFIYVTDQNNPGIHVFDKELNFKQRIPVQLPVVDIQVLSDNLIAVETFTIQQPGKILFIDSQGKIKSEFDYSKSYPKNSPLMIDLVEFKIDAQGNIYLAYSYQDRIEKWTNAGKIIWSKNLLGIKKVKSEKTLSFLLPQEIIYKDIALDSSGHVFVLGGHLSKNRSRDVYVLSPAGKLQTAFVLPEFSHCIYIDRHNFLYSRANDGITLKKHRLKYN